MQEVELLLENPELAMAAATGLASSIYAGSYIAGRMIGESEAKYPFTEEEIENALEHHDELREKLGRNSQSESYLDTFLHPFAAGKEDAYAEMRPELEKELERERYRKEDAFRSVVISAMMEREPPTLEELDRTLEEFDELPGLEEMDDGLRREDVPDEYPVTTRTLKRRFDEIMDGVRAQQSLQGEEDFSPGESFEYARERGLI